MKDSTSRGKIKTAASFLLRFMRRKRKLAEEIWSITRKKER
jgi:hypothetical protein